MATHSSSLAWRIPWTEEPDGLQSMGSQRVLHDRVISRSLVEKETCKAKVPVAHKSQNHLCVFYWRLPFSQHFFFFSITFYSFISSSPLPTLYYFRPLILLTLAFSG